MNTMRPFPSFSSSSSLYASSSWLLYTLRTSPCIVLLLPSHDSSHRLSLPLSPSLSLSLSLALDLCAPLLRIGIRCGEGEIATRCGRGG